jgi:hypothetical protein
LTHYGFLDEWQIANALIEAARFDFAALAVMSSPKKQLFGLRHLIPYGLDIDFFAYST